MTLTDLISQVQRAAELIGPNLYLQAAIIAVAFIFLGKVADRIISGIIGRFARQSSNDFDDLDVTFRAVTERNKAQIDPG